jgi:hypothetical protein
MTAHMITNNTYSFITAFTPSFARINQQKRKIRTQLKCLY